MPARMLPAAAVSADVSKAEGIRNRPRAGQTQRSLSALAGPFLTIARWIPPQRVQRMVQYSAPARPGMMRRTASEAPQSGQLDRAGVACRICSDWGIVMLRPPTSPTAA